ncbi:hypothetical protein [Gottfriedia luciferensis]|uniref:hypothetical protein n=1 Tax=Gottfriedia luciferensis TaxID=178774 RepID=UPI0011550212|nr:hypothetical protein [Gottfriedia luciferensis]
MYKSINLFSFLLSLICLVLFLSSFSLKALFALCFITIITGLIGFMGTNTLGGKIRSVFTLILSSVLLCFITLVITFGNLFQFT